MGKIVALIDCQNDFIDGSLAVGYDKWSNAYNYIASKLLTEASEVIFTKDSHPVNHCSFKEQGGPWPSHCVEGTKGCDFYWKLNEFIRMGDVPTSILKKGQDYSKEEYGINVLKNKSGIEEVHIAGLCTDYCVKESSIMTAKENSNTTVYVHLQGSCYIAEDTKNKAIEEMKQYSNIKIVL